MGNIILCFLSFNNENTSFKGAWNSGASDCKTLLGDGATLVAIESEEEWDFLKEILQNHGFGRQTHPEILIFFLIYFLLQK